MLNDFKAFLLRGNVIDLAVAIVIGVAFTAVIAAVQPTSDRAGGCAVAVLLTRASSPIARRRPC